MCLNKHTYIPLHYIQNTTNRNQTQRDTKKKQMFVPDYTLFSYIIHAGSRACVRRPQLRPSTRSVPYRRLPGAAARSRGPVCGPPAVGWRTTAEDERIPSGLTVRFRRLVSQPSLPSRFLPVVCPQQLCIGHRDGSVRCEIPIVDRLVDWMKASLAKWPPSVTGWMDDKWAPRRNMHDEGESSEGESSEGGHVWRVTTRGTKTYPVAGSIDTGSFVRCEYINEGLKRDHLPMEALFPLRAHGFRFSFCCLCVLVGWYLGFRDGIGGGNGREVT